MYVKQIWVRNDGPIMEKVIRVLLADESIDYTIPEQPRGQLPQCCLTDVGRAVIEGMSDGNAGTGA